MGFASVETWVDICYKIVGEMGLYLCARRTGVALFMNMEYLSRIWDLINVITQFVFRPSGLRAGMKPPAVICRHDAVRASGYGGAEPVALRLATHRSGPICG
jgi:hypothetical protein